MEYMNLIFITIMTSVCPLQFVIGQVITKNECNTVQSYNDLLEKIKNMEIQLNEYRERQQELEEELELNREHI